MNNYENAVAILEENEELCDFVGEFDHTIIEKAEETLGVNFPETYRRFLTDYGAGDFGSQEFYGIVSEDFHRAGIPNSIWLTLKERAENNLPKDIVIIYYTGDEYYYCLDTSEMTNEECPVILVSVGALNEKGEVIYKSFGEFFFDIVKEEV